MASYSAVDRLVLAALALAREVERDSIPLDTIDELEEAPHDLGKAISLLSFSGTHVGLIYSNRRYVFRARLSHSHKIKIWKVRKNVLPDFRPKLTWNC